MRYFLLVTAERRPLRPFTLKDVTGRVAIGTMLPNPDKSRHEMELDEPTYLKHAKSIALACRIHGNTVYIENVRDDAESPAADEPEKPDAPAADIVAEPIAVFSNSNFLLLKKVAKLEHVNIEGVQGCAAIAEKINAARAAKAQAAPA